MSHPIRFLRAGVQSAKGLHKSIRDFRTTPSEGRLAALGDVMATAAFPIKVIVASFGGQRKLDELVESYRRR